MERALKDAPVLDFKIPDGITSRTLCPVSGLPLGPYCPEPGRAEYFIKGTEPAEECRLCRPPFWWPWLPSIKYSPSFP
jgi:membrane carboxypeptidase/penicillin-binding protein